VGAFQLDSAEPESSRPEAELCEKLKRWRKDLISSSDLQSSGLKRAHVNLNRQISFAGKSARMASWASRLVSRRIYKHMQYEDARTYEPGASDGLSAACIHCNQRQDRHERRFSGLYCNNQDFKVSCLQSLAAMFNWGAAKQGRQVHDEATRWMHFENYFGTSEHDNYHSPTRPQEYITRRLMPKLNFYRARIPQYARGRTLMRVFLLLCVFAASSMTYLKFEQFAIVVTSAAAAVTSWMEFSDTAHKIERYTRAVIDIQNLLSAWKSLSEVEKSSVNEIQHLILTGEEIIADERIAWVSVPTQKARQSEKRTDEGKAGDDQLGKMSTPGKERRRSTDMDDQ